MSRKWTGRSSISQGEAQEQTTIIVGQGLAGTAVAWALNRLGQKFVVIDPGTTAASHIAAGLITPVAGKRFAVAPHYESLFARASAFYVDIEKRLQSSFLLAQPAMRLCYTTEEVELFDKRSKALLRADQIRLCTSAELVSFQRPKLGFIMSGAARLVTARYLDASRHYFEKKNQLINAFVHNDEIRIQSDRVSIPSLGVSGSRIIFCGGHQDEFNPWLPGNVFNSAKGEVLTVIIEDYDNSLTVHARKSWLCPTDEVNVFSFGSTYEHDNIVHATTDRARRELEQRLSTILAKRFKVVNQQFGIRPIGMQRKAIIGQHAKRRNVAWLNGLGSKGSLLAPYLATELVESLLTGRALQVDLTEAHVSS